MFRMTIFQSDRDKQWYWNLRVRRRGEIIARGEGNRRKSDCKHGAARTLEAHAANTDFVGFD